MSLADVGNEISILDGVAVGALIRLESNASAEGGATVPGVVWGQKTLPENHRHIKLQ